VTCNAFKAGKINFDDLNFSKEYQDKLCYSQSKLANVLFTLKLSNLLKDTGVRVFSVDPGITQTNILRHSSYSQSSFSNIFIGPIFSAALKFPSKGAESIIFCCLEPDLISGSLYK
jgi:NAD(P)-dependent dehydrogenase (short-subunit alcohol dehydrogenase family)